MHPADLGFTLEMAFDVSRDGQLKRDFVTPMARETMSLLYVAWLSPAERALKTGLSEKSLWVRWANVLRNMERPLERLPFLRPNEIKDREKLLFHSLGQRVEIWMTPYPPTFGSRLSEYTTDMPLRSAEVFIDSRYAPLFGKPLSERTPWPT